jgi:hypothetical protein
MKALSWALAVLALANGSPSLATAAEADAWEALLGLRGALAAEAPLAAAFVQAFTPAGFSGGEEETGSVTFGLPECLRWDYDDPDPKSYLLCGHMAWTWNRGEADGRRYLVAADEERGLDLLRLRIEELRSRYRAELVTAAGGLLRVRLAPVATGGEIADAELTIAEGGRRLTALRYRDAEGNETRFTFHAYASVPRAARFDPPSGVTWIQD